MQCYSTNMTCLDTAGLEDGKIIEGDFSVVGVAHVSVEAN